MLEDKLDLTFYQGEDLYSDGDVEEELLAAVQEPQKLEETLLTGNSWPHLYHLSNIRENILDWYAFNPEGTLLEIGSGCGAVTGLFCRKVKHVTAIDLSKRRSMVNVTRNAAYDNLTVMLGNFEDIRLSEKFDYVTLIGVFEYSICYINSSNPFMDMLERAKSFLKPGGKLMIAIENKYGLKYFAGATEDHSGRNFDGLENYVAVDRVRTFSKGTLERMLKDAGFTKNDWYYPMPDYKLPEEIYSDWNLPSHGSIRNACVAYDRDRYELFDERLCYDSICGDGMFPEFANSFLVISEVAGDGMPVADGGAGNGAPDKWAVDRVTYAKYNRQRAPQFQIATRIVTGVDGKRWVEKTALRKEAKPHIAGLAEHRRRLSGISKHTVPVDILSEEEGVVRFPFIKGEGLAKRMNACLGRAEQLFAAVQEGLDIIFDFAPEAMTEFYVTPEFTRVFGELSPEAQQIFSGCRSLTVSNIDTIFDNFVADASGNYYCLDYEWVFDFPIPVEYLRYRTLFYFYSKNQAYIRDEGFLKHFGLTPEMLAVFARMEDHFQQYVHGENRKYIYTRNYEKRVINIGRDFRNGEPWFVSIMQNLDRLYEEAGNTHRELVESRVKLHRKSLFLIRCRNALRHPKRALRKLFGK